MADATSPLLPYKLEVTSASNVWTFPASSTAPAIRPTFETAFDTFLTNLTKDTSGAIHVERPLIPGAVSYMRQVAARGLPLTSAETLFASCGLNPNHRYVDLDAGMRVTLSFSGYQFIGPGGTYSGK